MDGEATRGQGLDRRHAVLARHALVAASGLFDPDWYVRHHPPAAGSDLDPFEHYLSRGVAALADPGPLFDAAAYLRDAWHLERGVDDPLTHFLETGLSEGRHAVSIGPHRPDPDGRPQQPWRSQGPPARPPRIAVAVHCFHLDVFDEIAEALARMPVAFSLLVSTDTPEKARQIRETVEAHRLDCLLRLHVGANRGRNFGPMLCGFRDAIAAHDLLLHLHTKRSLYRGSAQDGWRRTLLRSLLPAGPAISGLLARFQADPALGVLSPSIDPSLRYWAYGWLSNRHLAQPLFDRLGLSAPVPDGMFDYPLGGMFWARTDALAPLLRHRWTPDDFPVESGQADGTLMHAIERSIIAIARDRGYDFAELDYERGLVRPGWGGRGLEAYARADHGALLDSIARADTISFDLFDTLVTRLCLAPDAVHRFIGLSVSRHFPGAEDYVSLRRAAETRARSLPDGAGDVDLDQIHACFRDLAGPGWSEAAIAHVEAEEVALDLRVLRPRAIMIEALRFARAQGRRVILVSDSYLPRRHLDTALRRFGLTDLVDAVYLSSEQRARKDRGDLWARVLAAETADGQRLLHVGDNAQSDIQRTADLGLPHFHVLDPAQLLVLKRLAPAHPRGPRPLGDDILLGPVAARLFNNPHLDPAGGPPLLARPEEAGAVLFGPLLLAFTAWLSQHPSVRHLDRLFFVSREGYFLKRLYDVLRQAAGRTDLPRSAYFHCSRRAALSALQGLGLDAEPVLRGAGFCGTLSAFLEARLGLHPDPALRHDRTAIALPGDAALVRCMMALMQDGIVSHGRQALRGLSAYAEAAGMTPGRMHGFVDVGYSGTMQAALQSMLGVRLVGLYMGVSEAASQVRHGGGHAFGAFADGDVSGFTGGYGLMLEAILTAPHGQTIGYDTSVSPPAPVFRHGGLSQERFDILERIYRGAEDYALGLLNAYGPDLLDVPFRPDAATAMLAALRDGRLRLDPALACSLSVEDAFCGNGEIDVFDRLAAGRETTG